MIDQIDIGKDFDELFRQHYKMAVMYAHKYVYDMDEARDIAQNVFIKLYDKKDEISLKTSMKSYILAAVKNASLNHIRGRSTRQKHNEQAMEFVTATYEHHSLEYEDLLNTVNRELQHLPPRCQEVFTLNRLKGLKNKEIAEQLNISIRTVETQISKALKHLRTALPKSFLMLLFFVLYTCFTAGWCHVHEGKHKNAWDLRHTEVNTVLIPCAIDAGKSLIMRKQ